MLLRRVFRIRVSLPQTFIVTYHQQAALPGRTNMLSVIVPSHNGGSKLLRCLDALANQSTQDFEIVLVDSRSTDHSIKTAAAHWQTKETAARLRVVHERRPGAQFARLRGAREAVSEYLVFCDDDNLLRSDYLEQARQLIESYPSVGFIGGFGIAVPDRDVTLPEWFDSVKKFFAAPGVPEHPVSMAPVVGTYTAGLVARRRVFEDLDRLKFTPLLTGRVGRSLVAGEDIEMCKVAALLGYTTCQDSRLVFDHIMTAGRFTKRYARKLCYAMGVARCRHRAYDFFLGETMVAELNQTWLREVNRNWKPAVKSLLSLIRSPAIAKADARVQLSYFQTLLSERRAFFERLEEVADLADRCGIQQPPRLNEA